jgi:two-component system CheB/CheR fusion protein
MGFSEEEALAMKASDRMPADLQHEELARLIAASQARVLTPQKTRRLHKNGDSIEVAIVASALIGESGQIYAISTTERRIEK